MIFIFIILTFFSTFLGGLVSLRYRDSMHIILGFTAGALLAVVAFDIFPEIIELIEETNIPSIYPMIGLVVGFLGFHIAEKMLLVHHSHEEHYGAHKHPSVGVLSALALAGHSFLDGVGIGLGFQVSESVGVVVAIAVIAHDFSDGLNTVSLMLAHKNSKKRAMKYLLVDAMAPLAGGFATMFFSLSESALTVYLGFFAGFLLYIGASDILPEAHSHGSSIKTVAATLVGVLFIALVTQVL